MPVVSELLSPRGIETRGFACGKAAEAE